MNMRDGTAEEHTPMAQGDGHPVDAQQQTNQQGQNHVGPPAPPANSEYNPPRMASVRLSLHNVDHAFTFQPWGQDQMQRGREVTAALIFA